MSTIISNFDLTSFFLGVVFMMVCITIVVTWALCSMNADEENFANWVRITRKEIKKEEVEA
jgi:cbb3-type cytochrome oxidase subunit 1